MTPSHAASAAALRVQVLEVQGLTPLERAYGTEGGLRAAVTESDQVIYVAPSLLTENAVRLSGIEADAEVALAILPPPPAGVDPSSVTPVLASSTLDLQRVRATGTPTFADGVAGKLWEAWLELGACQYSGRAAFDAVQQGARMRVSVLMEEDHLPTPTLIVRDPASGEMQSPVPSPDPSCLGSTHSFRLGGGGSSGVNIADAYNNGSCSTSGRPAGPAAAAQQMSAAPSATNLSAHIADLEAENQMLRSELEQARQEAAALRQQHEQDRGKVQETLRNLEADVHTRWQRYVAELETEITRLTAVVMNSPGVASGSAPASWPGHASPPAPAHSTSRVNSGRSTPVAPPPNFAAHSRAPAGAAGATGGGMHWPEIVDRGGGAPLLDCPRMTPPTSFRAQVEEHGSALGSCENLNLASCCSSVGSVPSHGGNNRGVGIAGETAKALQQTGLQPPRGLSVPGLGKLGWPRLEVPAVSSAAAPPYRRHASAAAAPAVAATAFKPQAPHSPAGVPAAFQAAATVPSKSCVCTPVHMLHHGQLGAAQHVQHAVGAPPDLEESRNSDGEMDSSFFGFFDAMYNQVLSGMHTGHLDNDIAHVATAQRAPRELVMDPRKEWQLQGRNSGSLHVG
mmetsp:Transcript_68903/g.165381  ORF Transcript_68903/g.165381 Transcript_68903/m.165381 type:complete len:625 (-) Transcript_68903:78-1952(-)